MGRKSKLDWELYKPQLLQARADGRSLTSICKVLYEKLGVTITAARLSQKLTEWKKQAGPDVVITNEELEQRLNEAVTR